MEDARFQPSGRRRDARRGPGIGAGAAAATAPRDSGEPLWSGWQQVPGGMGTMCAPCASADINRTFYLVVRGADSRIYYNSVVAPALAWSGWRQIPGGGRTPSSPCAVTWDDLDDGNTLTVLAEDENGRIQNNFYSFLDDAWRGWHLLPGGLTRSAPAASWRDGVFYVVAQDLNNGIQYKRLLDFRDHSSWTGWLALPGGLTPSAPSAASGFSEEDQILTVVVRGFDGSIFENTTIPRTNRTWSGWTQVGGGGRTSSGPAAISTFDCGRPPIVVRGMDNGVFYNLRAPDLWRPIPGGLTLSAPAAADVDACVPAGGTLGTYRFVFVRGLDVSSSVPHELPRPLRSGQQSTLGRRVGSCPRAREARLPSDNGIEGRVGLVRPPTDRLAP